MKIEAREGKPPPKPDKWDTRPKPIVDTGWPFMFKMTKIWTYFIVFEGGPQFMFHLIINLGPAKRPSKI